MSSNQERKSIEFFSHHIDKWDSDTKHIIPTQEDIYGRLRSLYFKSAGKSGQNGRIEDNFELLCFRLGCHGDSDRSDLMWVLKDKFKKLNKYYRHQDWDKQIKDIRHAMRNADTKNNT